MSIQFIFLMKFRKGITRVRDRSSAVIIENKMVALIRRERNGMVYFVFPGGGIEDNKKQEDGVRKEALEELGVS